MGRSSAQLIKITEVIPAGFELAGKPETYRVEDSYLNMKGERLDPLKTEAGEAYHQAEGSGRILFETFDSVSR